jgi:chloride channel protein, CIC family
MFFSSFRQQLAYPKVSWQLCLLCSIGGLAAALFIIAFIATIELIQSFFSVIDDNYTSLDPLSRFDLPILGALVILFFSWMTGYQYARTGIPFVLHRLKIAYGIMPFRNTFNQFIGGVVSLSTGFSVGREGPVVHLGAAASSFIGSRLNLPYNSIRTLCASGIAAGIAASFNTPIAAVIFVMEVILREYDVHMFIPIMLAAIIGSMLTSQVFGSVHDYEFLANVIVNYQHFPVIILAGIFIGILASGFNRYIVAIIKQFEHWHIFTRFMLAALITGALGYFVPYAMGTGSSAVVFLHDQSAHLQLVVGLLAAKFLMTIFAIGLGMPGGIVGPIIGIGAIAGACAGLLLNTWFPSINITSELTLLGMAAFMAATLNAPLAALLAVVELSHQLDIMLPAMVIITTACLVSGQIFKNKSVFIMQLDWQKLPYRRPPIETTLQKIGVLSKMKSRFKLIDEPLAQANLVELLEQHKALIFNDITCDDPKQRFILVEAKSPGMKQPLLPLSSQATLAEAYLALHKVRKGGVYLYQHDMLKPEGYITFKQIRHYLLADKV